MKEKKQENQDFDKQSNMFKHKFHRQNLNTVTCL